MALAYSVTLRNNQLNQISTAIGTSGLLRIYSGTRPATGGATTTLLAELPLSATAAPAASSGSVTFNAITADASADNTGTATWFRVTTSGGTHVIDGDVGTSGSDLNLSSTSIVAGGNVSVTSFVVSAGNA
jgi:hypothetical protein